MGPKQEKNKDQNPNSKVYISLTKWMIASRSEISTDFWKERITDMDHL